MNITSVSSGEKKVRELTPRPVRSTHLPLYRIAKTALAILVGCAVAFSVLRLKLAVKPGALVAVQDLVIWTSPTKEEAGKTIDEPSARYELRNTGGEKVRVLEITTSCGCAAPRVEPNLIQPGDTAVVEVHANPLQTGERMVQILLRTDSLETPELKLALKIVGSRIPPYLSHMSGDLGYTSDFSKPVTRVVYAFTAEPETNEPNPPVASTTTPNLSISEGSLVDEVNTIANGVVLRKYEYEVVYHGTPDRSIFAGQVEWVDPWDSSHKEALRVHGEVVKDLRVFPTRLVFWVDRKSQVSRPATQTLAISSNQAMDELKVCPAGMQGVPFDYKVEHVSGQEGSFMVSVDLSKHDASDGEYKMIVESRKTNEQIVVPIAIRSNVER